MSRCRTGTQSAADLNLVSAANPELAASMLNADAEAATADAGAVVDALPPLINAESIENKDIDPTAARADERPEPKRLKRASTVELALSVLLRNRNMHLMPFLLVCITLMLFKSGASAEVWDIFMMFSIAFNKEWIEDFFFLRHVLRTH